MAELKRNLGGQTVNGADQDSNLLTAATQTAAQPVTNGDSALQAKLASVMLDMLRMDAAVQAQGHTPLRLRVEGAGGRPSPDAGPQERDVLYLRHVPHARVGYSRSATSSAPPTATT